MESVSAGAASAARTESLTAIFLLVVVSTVIAGVDLASRSKDLALSVDHEREGRIRAARTRYLHKGFYETMGDQSLLEEMPRADYSRGSVCLIGGSTLAVATRVWDLPPEL